MGLNIAVQMDPIETIAISGDSTFALMLEADRRGHDLFVYHPDSLAMRDGEVAATGTPVAAVRDTVGDHVDLRSRERRRLTAFDAVLMRQDPPFDMQYISATHLLERVHPDVLVVNDPMEVRNAPEKLFVCDYPDLMPPTLITKDRSEIDAFRREHRDIIVKPLYGNGGAGVFKIAAGDHNLGALIELFDQSFREPFIVQRYLPDVTRGDKRIILVDGEPAGAINRVPAGDENRSNMHVGGRPEPTTLTDREREICARIGPELKRRGFIFVGIDVIGAYLTEINVTSPTGIREVKTFGGGDIAAMIFDVIEDRCR